MEARMKNPAAVVPGAWPAINQLHKAITAAGLPEDAAELVHLRISQVNGCSACVATAAKSKQSPERLTTVAAWREAPCFTDAERAALALADNPDAVPDATWAEAARHYDERALAALVLLIAETNLFNRLNRVTRQPAGVW